MVISELQIPVLRAFPGLALWLIEPDWIGERRELQWSCMDADERRRAAKIASEQRRRLFVASHVGLRHILASYLGIAPHAVRYHPGGPAGKPQLHPSHGSTLRFNLSHTRGLALVAVARDREVGVDVEWIGRRIDLARHRHHFEAPERQWARQPPHAATRTGIAGHEPVEPANPEQQRRRLLMHWSRQEAIAKLTGEGLAGVFARRGRPGDPLKGVSTLLDLAPTSEHVGALAIADTRL